MTKFTAFTLLDLVLKIPTSERDTHDTHYCTVQEYVAPVAHVSHLSGVHTAHDIVRQRWVP